jgi:predicted acyltransferase
MAGLDFVIFAMFLWLIDGQGYRRWAKPLAIMGMNAIAVYLASEFLDEAFGGIRWSTAAGRTNLHVWLYQHLFAWMASPINASLLYAIAYVLLMYGIAYAMYRRGWFLKV